MEYWPEVLANTKTQYFPVRLEPARLVSSLLYGTLGHTCFEFAGFQKQKNTQPMTVSMETVLMVKSRPRKLQERSDLPQDFLAI